MASQDRRIGVDQDGFILSEASLARLPEAYARVPGFLWQAALGTFGERLHSAYLYGSLVRGTAKPGVSDLDVILLLTAPSNEGDSLRVSTLEQLVAETFPFVVDPGIILESVLVVREHPMSSGWGPFLRIGAACIGGEDIIQTLPRYCPTPEVARGLNGDLQHHIDGLAERIRNASDMKELEKVCRGFSRKLIRTALCLVMTRACSWTSDLDQSCELFVRYYPQYEGDIHTALRWAQQPTTTSGELLKFAQSFGTWLASEFDRQYPVVQGSTTAREMDDM